MDKRYTELQKKWIWNIPYEYNIGRDCTDKHAGSELLHNKTAIIWENEYGNAKKYTYSELSDITNKVANALLGIGLVKGDRVVIRLDNVPEFIFVFLGALKAGIIPIPTSPMLTSGELEYILTDSRSKCIVTSPGLYEAVDIARSTYYELSLVISVGDETPSGCTDYNSLINKASDKRVTYTTLAEDIAYICYTSGTTGDPKGVVHAHRALIGHDPAAIYWQALKDDSIVLHAGKLNWTYTMGTGCLDPLRHGCTAVIYGGSHNPKKYFELINKYNVNIFMAVPTVYRHMIRIADEVGDVTDHLTHGLSAGEHLSEDLFRLWQDKLSITLYDGLGMSEFSYYLSNMPGFDIKPGSPGRPQPGHRSKLVDPGGNESEKGQMGILATDRNDPGIMLGYWNKPDETRNMFKDNLFLSGDYFYTDDDGYYWIVGREDDIISSFGYRISPHEIERVLINHKSVVECAVAGINIDADKTLVCAFIVTDVVNRQDELKKDIENFLKKQLAGYKIPKQIEFIRNIPKTRNGKIKRSELRELYSKV